VWTDEAIIETGEHPIHPRITRKPGEEYLPRCIVPTFQSGYQAITISGCISHGYKGPIICLETEPYKVTPKGRRSSGGLSSKGYADQVLSGPIKDYLAYLEKEKGRPILLVEDGSGPHRGKEAKMA
jgi:hypothetical protein